MGAVETSPPRWSVLPRDLAAEATLERELGIGSLLARVLVARGLTDPAEASRFLKPEIENLHDPRLLPDYDRARDVLLDARDRKLSIFVHGDYDVDGVTSAALFTRYLQNIGCEVTTHVPHRQREGYGIHMMAVEYAKEAGAEVFLTCDCGTAAIAQVELARSHGMRVVVTDHHEVGETLPNAEAVINPHRRDSAYPFAELSGVGVAFKLGLGLTRELGMPEGGYTRAFADLAALGTIADVMPLVDENRIIARFGLGVLPTTRKLGLQALMRKIGIDPGARVRSWDVGFRIGPRLNAAGRVDDARTSLDLLLTTDPEVAYRLAETVDANNQARRDAQQRILDEADAMILADPRGLPMFIVVAAEGWHPGIVGIVAGRIAERYRRPTIVAGIDAESGMCRGSARSVIGFNLAEAIHAFPDLMQGGGHAVAAGCSFAMDQLPAVQEALDGYARARISEEDLVPQVTADLDVELDELTLESVAELEQLEPFGRHNPEPILLTHGARLESARATRDGKHLQTTWAGPGGTRLDAIGFGMGEGAEALQPGHAYELLFEAKLEEWQGRTKVKLTLRDYCLP